MAVLSDNSIKPPSTGLSNLTGAGVIIDIGTGDGRFVYQSARRNPNKFYIGIDPNTRPRDPTEPIEFVLLHEAQGLRAPGLAPPH